MLQTQLFTQEQERAFAGTSAHTGQSRSKGALEWRALWHSSLTTGTLLLGVHMETTPLAWPRHCTPFQGLCRITSHGPSRVRCCATIRPVLVSCVVTAAQLNAPSRTPQLAPNSYGDRGTHTLGVPIVVILVTAHINARHDVRCSC